MSRLERCLRAAKKLAACALMAVVSGCGVATGHAAARTVVNLTWLTRSDMGPKVLHWETAAVRAYERLHPDVHVTVISVPWSAYNAKLLALTAAGTPPDVYATFAAGFGTFLAKGTLRNLTPFVHALDVPLSQWDSSAIAALSRSGKLYGLPLDNMPSLLFYNASLFRKAHIAPPPTSWGDRSWTVSAMLHDAKAIARNAGAPTKAVWGLNMPPGQFGTDISWLWGCDPFSATGGGPTTVSAYRTGVVATTDFTSPCYTGAMRFEKDLAVRDHVSPLPTEMAALSTLGDPFTSGRIGMETNGYWLFQTMLADRPGFQWGVAPFPYGPGGKNTTKLWTDAWVMSRHAVHPTAAFRFMLFLTTGAEAQSFAVTTGFFPALTKLDNSTLRFDASLSGMQLTYGQLRQVVMGGLARGQAFEAPGHTLANFVQLNTAWSNATDNLFLGKESTAAAMAGLKKAFAPLVQGTA